jgi:hypothetical protein
MSDEHKGAVAVFTEAQFSAAIEQLNDIILDEFLQPGDYTFDYGAPFAALRAKGVKGQLVQALFERLQELGIVERRRHTIPAGSYPVGDGLFEYYSEPETTDELLMNRETWSCWFASLEKAAQKDPPQAGAAGRTADAPRKQTRKRTKRIPALLLALLEGDRIHLGKSQGALAVLLECHPTSISRAFADRDYGHRLRDLYKDHGSKPPTAEQI